MKRPLRFSPLLVVLAVAMAMVCGAVRARAQALPPAARLADLQTGFTFSYANPDYGTSNSFGYGFYGDLDFRKHIGVEFDFHQIPGGDGIRYERSYEFGPRYVHHIMNGRFAPYAKGLYGRGVFNFDGYAPNGQLVQIANLAFNMYVVGGGLDMRAIRGLNIRLIDFDHQVWMNFPPHNLSPNVFSFGVAYHFHGDLTD